MQPNVEFLTLSGNLFTFTNYKCNCLVDVTHTDDGDEVKRLKIKSNPDKPIRFAYTPERGMVRINSAGTVTDDAVLDEMLSLRDGDCDALINYFEKYGFIIPISQIAYESYKFEDLFGIIRRMQYAIKLMAKIQEPEKNYKAILYLVSYLIFSQPITINSKVKESYNTCIHSIILLIKNADLSKENNLTELPFSDADYTDKYYMIPDSITETDYKMYFTDYYSKFDETDQFGTPLHKDDIAYLEILYLFKNALDVPVHQRQIIDFFFHLQNDISSLKAIEIDGRLIFSRRDAEERFNKAFNDKMQRALLGVAKATIKDEIDHAISAITPDYSIETMSASWLIPDYIAGLYFSIFYMDSNLVIYRQCENPACRGFFRVSTTNNRKRYCCDNCRNAAGQRRHRKIRQLK